MDQQIYMCPAGDFSRILGRDDCEIATDVIDTVTKKGITLGPRRKLEANAIVNATGLHLEHFGGIDLRVDRSHQCQRPLRLALLHSDGLPNLAHTTGYI